MVTLHSNHSSHLVGTALHLLRILMQKEVLMVGKVGGHTALGYVPAAVAVAHATDVLIILTVHHHHLLLFVELGHLLLLNCSMSLSRSWDLVMHLLCI